MFTTDELQIQQEIAKNIVPIISMLMVLSSALGTGVFHYLSIKQSTENENARHFKKLKAEFVTQHRREWLDSIRNSSKDLLAEYHVVQLSLFNTLTKED